MKIHKFNMVRSIVILLVISIMPGLSSYIDTELLLSKSKYNDDNSGAIEYIFVPCPKLSDITTEYENLEKEYKFCLKHKYKWECLEKGFKLEDKSNELKNLQKKCLEFPNCHLIAPKKQIIAKLKTDPEDKAQVEKEKKLRIELAQLETLCDQYFPCYDISYLSYRMVQNKERRNQICQNVKENDVECTALAQSIVEDQKKISFLTQKCQLLISNKCNFVQDITKIYHLKKIRKVYYCYNQNFKEEFKEKCRENDIDLDSFYNLFSHLMNRCHIDVHSEKDGKYVLSSGWEFNWLPCEHSKFYEGWNRDLINDQEDYCNSLNSVPQEIEKDQCEKKKLESRLTKARVSKLRLGCKNYGNCDELKPLKAKYTKAKNETKKKCKKGKEKCKQIIKSLTQPIFIRIQEINQKCEGWIPCYKLSGLNLLFRRNVERFKKNCKFERGKVFQKNSSKNISKVDKCEVIEKNIRDSSIEINKLRSQCIL